MSGRSVEHATFVVERRYEVSPERAFAAWADPEAKARWFVDSEASLELDFRVGGWERSRGTAPDGKAYSYEALYQDIVPAERIVYTYDMHLEETRISVSLATVEFRPVGDNGTRLVFTEQGAFLDGHEFPARRAGGMGSLLDALEKEVQSERAFPGGGLLPQRTEAVAQRRRDRRTGFAVGEAVMDTANLAATSH
jgi:uncharacterized protein YndB with AHSA1/START domain